MLLPQRCNMVLMSALVEAPPLALWIVSLLQDLLPELSKTSPGFVGLSAPLTPLLSCRVNHQRK